MLSPNFSKLLGPLARGEDLTRILMLLCETIEMHKAAQQAFATVVLYDAGSGNVLTGAAPSLPEKFAAAVNAVGTGPEAGTAGTAIHRREPVIVRDIANDALWKNHRDLALDHSIHAAWAMPIFGKNDAVLGALVLYFPKPRRPANREVNEISELALIAGLAIERSQAERERAGRAQILATMVENLNQGVSIFDSNRRLTSYNRLYQDFYQFPDGFLKPGLLYDDIIRHLVERGEYGDVNFEDFLARRLVELKKVREHRKLRHRADGTTIAVYRGTLPDGGIICTFTDITVEVRATFESQRNARLLATTLDNINIGIRVIDGKKNLALCNQRYVDMFDLPPQIVRPGTPYAEFLRVSLGRHIPKSEKIGERIARRLKEFDSRLNTSEIRETISGRIILKTREPMPDGGIVNTYADITHIRQTEMQLQDKSVLLETSLANMDQGLLLFDSEARLRLVNQAYFRLMGLKPEDVLPGMHYADILRTLARSGIYRDQDPEKAIRNRVDGALAGHVYRNLARFLDGRIVSVHRKPVAGGGFAITFTDMTNEVRAGEEAKAKSDLLQMTQEFMAQGICMMDKNLVLSNFNKRWQEIFNLPPEIARPGVPLADILRFRAIRGDLGPGDIEEMVQDRLARYASGEAQRSEHMQQNGRIISIERTPAPNGGYIATYTDVTERWKTERELERKSLLLETMFQNISQGIAVFDGDYRLISRNSQYRELLELPQGYPQVGTTYDDIIRKLAEDGNFGSRTVADLLAEFRHAIENTEQSAIEHTTTGGQNLIVNRSRMPHGGFVITLTDITKTRAAEREAAEKSHLLELALANMSQGIAIHDAELRLVTCNEKYIRWRGNLPPELLRPGVAHEETLRFRAERGDYGGGDIEEHIHERLDKMRRGDIHSPTRVVDGRVIRAEREPMPDGGFVTTYTDISDIKQVEDELIRARDTAEAANRAKTEFLANMSHELRTPLNAIIGFSEIMRNGIYGPLNDPRYIEYSANIVDSGQHLLSLIDDILDLSKIEVGRMTLHEDVFDLGRLIESCLMLVRDQAAATNISLESKINDALPPVRGDSRRIKQVILNLLQNAIKFTPGPGQVRVIATLSPEGNITIMVIDTGIGMKPEDIPRALERFGQVEGSLSRQYNGAGLGLPLAKSLMEMHGGSLAISSRPGQGTQITLTFPKNRIGEPVTRRSTSPRLTA